MSATVQLSEVCSMVTDGTHYTPPTLDHGVPFLTVKDIGEGGLAFDSSARISAEEFLRARSGNSAPQLNDVLFSKDGTVGKVHVVSEAREFAVLSSIAILRPQMGVLDSEYLGHALRSPTVLRSAIRLQTGTAIRRVILADLQRIVIPLPPIDEQRRIARILDAADELRVKRRRAVRNVDALPTSTFMRLFAGSGGWSRWPLRPLEDLVENQDSRRVPLKASDRTNRSGPFPYYGASGEIDRVDDYIFEGERLLVAEDGANLVTRTSPVAFIARGRFWVNNHAHVVAGTDRLDLHYLQRYLELTDLGPFITGTAQPKLNRSNLDRMLIPTPPMSQQQKFARMVEQVSNVADAHRAHLTRLEALFVSLEARAFAGEL